MLNKFAAHLKVCHEVIICHFRQNLHELADDCLSPIMNSFLCLHCCLLHVLSVFRCLPSIVYCLLQVFIVSHTVCSHLLSTSRSNCMSLVVSLPSYTVWSRILYPVPSNWWHGTGYCA